MMKERIRKIGKVWVPIVLLSILIFGTIIANLYDIGDENTDYRAFYVVGKGYDVPTINRFYASYDGVLYSKDYKRLIVCPSDKKSIEFHPNMEIIGEGAFGTCSITPLVIPWGVTTIEADAFSGASMHIFVPDTAIHIDEGADNTTPSTDIHFHYSYQYAQTEGAKNLSISDGDIVEDWYKNYGIKMNSWKTFNGKKYYFTKKMGWGKLEPYMVSGWQEIDGVMYYFDETGVLTKSEPGWREIDENLYYFDDAGAIAQDCWKEIDGKWTRFGEEGGVKKGFWISIAAWFRGLWS